MQVAQIYAPVQHRLDRVDGQLSGLSDVPPEFLSKLIGHVVGSTGKRVRPALTLLSSGFHEHSENVSEKMAVAVELLHLATLIHDDTVDDSDLRRGKATISSLWGRNVAVLLGDYLFATSAIHVCDTNNVYVIRRFSETITELSKGELFELASSCDWTQDRDAYYERIYNKTASLFTISCESGAILSGASEAQAVALKGYGYNLGMAFQIVDDILDFSGSAAEIGKPVGSDLANGVMTIPSIIAGERFPNDNRVRRLIEDIRNKDALREAVEQVQDPAVMAEAESEAERFGSEARRCLDQLPDRPERSSLLGLVDYVLSRRT